VVTGQALRESLANSEQIAAFVARLRAGEALPESDQDAELGRARSLAASLDYGFARAFTDAERAQLAVLHLFRDTVDKDALRLMGDRSTATADEVPELDGLDDDACAALLDRAADIGLLSPIGGGYYTIHPALPWYFAGLFIAAYREPAASAACRAYTMAVGALADYHFHRAGQGFAAEVLAVLAAEEGNLLHGVEIGLAQGLLAPLVSCLQALSLLYDSTGRNGEWARLVADVAPVVTDVRTGEALAGRAEAWATITSYLARIANTARDWSAAEAFSSRLLAWSRGKVEGALTTPADIVTEVQRSQILNYAVDLADHGHILIDQNDPGCLSYFQESMTLAERYGGGKLLQAQLAVALGSTYLTVAGLRDLDQAERWFRRSLSLRPEGDALGRAVCLGSLAKVGEARFMAARDASAPDSDLEKHLNDSLRDALAALELSPADDHGSRAITESQIGTVYQHAGDVVSALRRPGCPGQLPAVPAKCQRGSGGHRVAHRPL
jgi:hypothetical protein